MRDVYIKGRLLDSVSEYDFGNAEPGSYSRRMGKTRFPLDRIRARANLITGLFVTADSDELEGGRVLIAVGMPEQMCYQGSRPLEYDKMEFPWLMVHKKRRFGLAYYILEEETYAGSILPQDEDEDESGSEEESDDE